MLNTNKQITITSSAQASLVVNKSKFLCFVYPINSKEELDKFLLTLKQEHPNATHICYAYHYFAHQTQSQTGYFESSEPKNSSGKPLHNLITLKRLVNILVVVVRYFGGTKLGVGLLTRSYSNVAKQALDNITMIEYEQQVKFSLQMPNLVFAKFSYHCAQNQIQITNKQFQAANVFVVISTSVTKINLDSFLAECINLYNINKNNLPN